ncbi:MAG: sigma factor [Phycisphaerae bacterium]
MSLIEPLSEVERRSVESHLPLVGLQLRRQERVDADENVRDDLFQEGCLALADAVRNHRPERHGSFAPYALARIHCAMGLYLRERGGSIRVPLTSQKRHRAKGRHDPGMQPALAPRRRARGLEGLPARRAEAGSGLLPRIGDVVRRRVDVALAAAEAEVLATVRGGAAARAAVRRVMRERVRIPEPESQTPVRGLARELGASLGRVTHTEAAVRRRARARLERDVVFRLMRRLARRRPMGMDAWLSEREATMLVRAGCRGVLARGG